MMAAAARAIDPVRFDMTAGAVLVTVAVRIYLPVGCACAHADDEGDLQETAREESRAEPDHSSADQDEGQQGEVMVSEHVGSSQAAQQPPPGRRDFIPCG